MNPTPGSIVFWQFGGWSAGISCGHAGLVIESGPGWFKTIEAITGGVQILTYYSTRGVVGFAHPF